MEMRLVFALAIFGVCAVAALPSEPVSADAIVPEHAEKAAAPVDWHAQRMGLWAADKDMLAKDDHAMFSALETSLDQKDSPAWAKYMRHKNLLPPQPEGHKWSGKNGEVTTAVCAPIVAASPPLSPSWACADHRLPRGKCQERRPLV